MGRVETESIGVAHHEYDKATRINTLRVPDGRMIFAEAISFQLDGGYENWTERRCASCCYWQDAGRGDGKGLCPRFSIIGFPDVQVLTEFQFSCGAFEPRWVYGDIDPDEFRAWQARKRTG